MMNRLRIDRPRYTRPLFKIFFTVFSEKTSLFTANTNIIEPSGTLAHHQVYLQQRYNRSLKKPLPKLVQEEDTLITAYLSQGKLNQVCDFLIRNKTCQLSSVLTVPTVNNYLHMQWETLTPSEKIKFSWALLHFGDYRAYLRLKEEIILKIDPALPVSRNIPLLTEQELNIYLYAEIVIQRGVTSLSGLRSPRSSRRELSAILAHYKETDVVDIHGYEDRGDEVNSMLQYFEVLAQGKVQQVIRQNTNQQHSVLEKDIDCYLEVLNYQKFRQVYICGHHVDFLIHPNAQPQQRTILEVFGGYHYTIDGKLKPSDIIKGLKLNQFARLRFVHFQDLNATKGNRNKLAYIQNVLMSPIINWDPTGKYDSHWQLDDYYREFQ